MYGPKLNSGRRRYKDGNQTDMGREPERGALRGSEGRELQAVPPQEGEKEVKEQKANH